MRSNMLTVIIFLGRGVFASGSPFDPFDFNGKQVVPSQCNNMFIFPGLGLAATVGKCRIITDEMIYKAGENARR